jgi:hypothetical protein
MEQTSHRAAEHVQQQARDTLLHAQQEASHALARVRELAHDLQHPPAPVVWHTNSTTPPKGEWLLHLEFDCYAPQCEFRILEFRDWQVCTLWKASGPGGYTLPLVAKDEPYLFRYQGGKALVSWIPMPPPLPAKHCPLAHPWLAAGLLSFLAALTVYFSVQPLAVPPKRPQQVAFQLEPELHDDEELPQPGDGLGKHCLDQLEA